MSKKDMLWYGFLTLVVALSFAHMVRSMYLSGLWEDCLDKWNKSNDAPGQVMVIDKCNSVLRKH